jgi:serine phosphatase RsbU (regulator of sigma subunit)
MSVALENARLFSETQRLLKEKERRNTELGIINSVQEGLASKLEFHEILELVGTKIREVFNADVIGIAIYDLSKGVIELPYMLDHGERFDGLNRPIYGTAQYLLNNSKPLLFKHIREIRQFMEEVGQDNIGGSTQDNSHMIVPILTGDHLIGIVDVGTLAEQAFNEQDLQLLQTLANSMSVALENAKLWEQEKLFRKALQRELDIGREIQAGFLPLELPRLEGWEIAASLMSAREVAGDFYDVFELPDGNIGLVIADVCDKGVGAALFMTLFRSLVRAAANLDHYENIQQESQPHSTRERLKLSMSLTNDYIAETHGESGMFATLFFGILDPRTGMLAYVNGGHEPPLVTHEGTVRRRLEKTGPAVGVLEKIEFQIAEVELQSGDVFFAFTDGLPDCQNPKGEFFGQERLNALLPKKASADEFVHIFETDLHQYVAGATQFDDITMLAVRRLPSAQ